jgi:hypothetical protein
MESASAGGSEIPPNALALLKSRNRSAVPLQ